VIGDTVRGAPSKHDRFVISHRMEGLVSNIPDSTQRPIVHQEPVKTSPINEHLTFHPNHIVPLKEDSFPLYYHYSPVSYQTE
jgi:hypothetical protein